MARKDGRRVIQVTLLSDVYDRIREHCDSLDLPITVWVRDLVKRELGLPRT